MSLEQQRMELQEALLKKREEMLGHTEHPQLDMKILQKRRVQTDYYDYEEWKIEYTVETRESMPIPAGQTVSAYLLIPSREGLEDPFPAMICFHQCNVDCPLAKEAVVGKVSYRPDQAYGLELVSEGFVVLAPDSINCGERFIPAIRSEGEGKRCWDVLDDGLGRNGWSKHHLDDIRAVDLLCSLEFVDSERIGAIGHSMGNIDARDVTTYDSRVKACILSGGLQPDRFIPLHSPRLHVALLGAFDGSQEDREAVRAAYEYAKRFYEADRAAENLVLSRHDCGHHFLDEFKWDAYARLRQYFGMDQPRRAVSLTAVVEDARCHHTIGRGDRIPEVRIPERADVIAEERRLIVAFGTLFIYLSTKRSDNPLVVEVKEDQSTISASYGIRSNIPKEVAATRMPFENYQRRAHQLFVGAGATMKQVVAPNALEYVVTLPKAH